MSNIHPMSSDKLYSPKSKSAEINMNLSPKHMTTVDKQAAKMLADATPNNTILTTVDKQAAKMLADATPNNTILTTVDKQAAKMLADATPNNTILTTVDIEAAKIWADCQNQVPERINLKTEAERLAEYRRNH